MIVQSLLEESQSTVKNLSSAGDTDDVIVARIKLTDVVGLIEIQVGDARAIDTATSQNTLADGLVARDPSNLEWLRLWAIARGRLSDALYWQCDCATAMQRAQEGADGAMKYLTAHPDDDYMHDRLLGDYQTIGDSARTLGDLDSADAAYQAWVKDATAAAAKQPDEVRWLADLAFGYERLGDQLELRGKPVEAAVQYQAYLDASTKMVKSNPRDANFLAGLAQSHERLGDSFLAQGNATKALERIQTVHRAGDTADRALRLRAKPAARRSPTRRFSAFASSSRARISAPATRSWRKRITRMRLRVTARI